MAAFVVLVINPSDLYAVVVNGFYANIVTLTKMYFAPELRCLKIREAQIYTTIAIVIIISLFFNHKSIRFK